MRRGQCGTPARHRSAHALFYGNSGHSLGWRRYRHVCWNRLDDSELVGPISRHAVDRVGTSGRHDVFDLDQ